MDLIHAVINAVQSVRSVWCLFVQVSVAAAAAAAAAAGKAKVYGPALEKAVKTFESTYLIVDCKEAGPGSVQFSSVRVFL